MTKKQAPQTEFKRWRKQMGLTQEAAAALLDVSSGSIENWDRGRERLRNSVQVPPYAVRVAMAVYAVEGKMPKAWPP